MCLARDQLSTRQKLTKTRTDLSAEEEKKSSSVKKEKLPNVYKRLLYVDLQSPWLSLHTHTQILYGIRKYSGRLCLSLRPSIEISRLVLENPLSRLGKNE